MSEDRSSGPGSITADQLADLRFTRLLDVRTPAEFESSHIVGAVNIPLHELSSYAGRLSGAGSTPLVVVCQSGARAQDGANILAKHGVHNLAVLQGGMNAWCAGRHDVQTGRQRWAMERQVRLVAGSIVLGSVVASSRMDRVKWVGAGVGVGLTFSALSNTCTMAKVLGRLPYNTDGRTDPGEAVRHLNSA